MMNKKEIFRKVGGIITELNDQYEYLSKSPENLNELELELFSANANFLCDHISVLLKLNYAEKKESDSLTTEIKAPLAEQTVTEEPEPHTDSDNQASKLKFDFDNSEEVNSSREEDMTQESEPIEEEEKNTERSPDYSEAKPGENERIEASAGEEVQTNKSPNQDFAQNRETILEQPEPFVKEVVISERTIALPADSMSADPRPTMNELFSRKEQSGSFGSQFSQKQTKDLKSMVSLNDKLLFVRDLFNGYSLAYSEAIELLNRFDSLEAAQNFLRQNYSVKNNWDAKSDTAQKFYEILEQRFAK